MVIGWFSCGITSAVACKIAAEIYEDDLVLVYIGIKSAHTDNARFIEQCERWIGKNILCIRSKKYLDQYDVIKKRRFINGPSGALCTYELKKKVRQDFEKENQFSAQVFGFEYATKEVNRAIRFAQQYPDTRPVFPLIDRKITKANCAAILEKAGIELPEMYKLGFENNNCIGCVKGGKAYWNRIRIKFPDHFDKMAGLEREVGRSCIKGEFLDQLDPMAGNGARPITPNCGTFCQIEFGDINHPRLSDIMNGSQTIQQLCLF